MPFVYYGGKKALARYYPPPRWPIIVEPFAGSAGYALWWAHKAARVVLVEKDPAVVSLWRRLQAPDALEDLRAIRCPPAGGKTDDPLLALCVGGEAVGGRWRPLSTEPLIALSAGGIGGIGGIGGMDRAFRGEPFTVTERMDRDWRASLASIISALPIVRNWEIIEGDYTAAPDVRATWFVDPPYWVPDDRRGTRGDGYRHGASGIDFDALGEWCQSRRGQVIVCEQEGATWLPFRPLRQMQTASGDRGIRTEVVWTRGEQIDRRTAAQRQDAAKRRAARRLR